MSLLSGVLSLAFVVAAGWFVIYYLVPKFEKGEFGKLGFATAEGGVEGSLLEEQSVPADIADTATGDELGTTEAKVEKEKSKKGKKKSKKTVQEMRLIEYITGDYFGVY